MPRTALAHSHQVIPYLTLKYLSNDFRDGHISQKNASGGLIKETIPPKVRIVTYKESGRVVQSQSDRRWSPGVAV